MAPQTQILHVQAEADLAGCERTCQTFIGRTPKQYDSTVLLLNHPGPAVAEWKKLGAKVICRPVGPGRIETYLQTYLAVKSTKPDLVILWTSMRLPLMVSACRMAGSRACAVHIGNPIRFSRRHRLASLIYGLLPKARSARIIPASHHIAKSLIGKPNYQGLGVQVCHNGIDLDQFAFKPKPKMGHPPIVGMSARLDMIKDHKTLLQAWQNVIARHSNATLELAGDGPLRKELEQLARDLMIDHSVKFLGRIGDMVQRCYLWDLVIHSTTSEEGLGNSMIEAMALGRPLIASDVGPVREIVGGNGAILVPPGDSQSLASAILQALEHESATKAQVNIARSLVEENFSSEGMVSAYLQLLSLPS